MTSQTDEQLFVFMISSEIQPESNKKVDGNRDVIIMNMKIGSYHGPGIVRQ